MDFDKLAAVRASIEKKKDQVKHFEKELERQKRKIEEKGSAGESKAEAQLRSQKLALKDKISAKHKQIETTEKKIEMYKKNNAKLTKQISNSKGSTKIIRLKQGIQEKTDEIKFLKEDNRRLEKNQRKLTKQLTKQQRDQERWPQKIQTLLTDVKVLQDKLAREAQRESKADKATTQHTKELKVAEAFNKKLKTQLQEYGHDDLISELRKAKQEKVKDWERREERLNSEIETLRKELEEKRRNIARKLKEKTRHIQSIKDQVAEGEAQLKDKQKATKANYYQVKKLKRELKQLIANGGGAYLRQVREAEEQHQQAEENNSQDDESKEGTNDSQGNAKSTDESSSNNNNNKEEETEHVDTKQAETNQASSNGSASTTGEDKRTSTAEKVGNATVTFESFQGLLRQTGQNLDAERSAEIFQAYSAAFPVDQQNIGTLLSFLLSGAMNNNDSKAAAEAGDTRADNNSDDGNAEQPIQDEEAKGIDSEELGAERGDGATSDSMPGKLENSEDASADTSAKSEQPTDEATATSDDASPPTKMPEKDIEKENTKPKVTVQVSESPE
eukprot:INCI7018.2.p2 GENE.INCI7018.2~~INCI7018.2.p2  ORF type:complete len:560 (+),score=167.34 INCI7018.2:174-1853(+)